MIVGVGIDIAEIDRVRAAIEQFGDSFLQRVYTPAEIAYCERHRSRFERYAARFAAKEATMKALGTGWRAGIRWRDIEIKNSVSGKPELHLLGKSAERAKQLGANQFLLTITHSGNLSLAQVIFES